MEESLKNFNLKRFIKVKNSKVIDTSLLLPHVECYFENDGKLYVEQIDGSEIYLGHIVKQSNLLKDLED